MDSGLFRGTERTIERTTEETTPLIPTPSPSTRSRSRSRSLLPIRRQKKISSDRVSDNNVSNDVVGNRDTLERHLNYNGDNIVRQDSYNNAANILSSDRFQTSFDNFTPKLNDVMNLSYMNTATFRNTGNHQTTRKGLMHL